MSRVAIGFRGAIAWTVLFLAPELAAHFRLGRWQAAAVIYAAATVTVACWPIPTLSRTVWDGETFWPVVLPVFVAVFVAILLAHFELHWSARWIILAGIVGAALVVSRLLEEAISHV